MEEKEEVKAGASGRIQCRLSWILSRSLLFEVTQGLTEPDRRVWVHSSPSSSTSKMSVALGGMMPG